MYTVIAQRDLPADGSSVWALLTEPSLLSRWFADCARLAPGEEFRFEFGDGDYHRGRVTEWSPGKALGWRWSFLDLGPDFDLRFTLLRRGQGTELSITDRGALTLPEAECLRLGWHEFLERLEKTIRRDTPARFAWRKMISFTGRVAAPRADIVAALTDPAWYAAAFPGAQARVEPAAERRLVGTLGHPDWSQAQTRLDLTFEPVDGTDYLFAIHEGWDELPPAVAAAERRAFVPRWQHAMAELGVR